MGTEMRSIPRTKPNVNDRYRADVSTPLPETVGAVPLDTLPEPPAAMPAATQQKPPRAVTLATTINYRDYDVTITATGMLLDEFCDMLDKRLGVVNS